MLLSLFSRLLAPRVECNISHLVGMRARYDIIGGTLTLHVDTPDAGVLVDGECALLPDLLEL